MQRIPGPRSVPLAVGTTELRPGRVVGRPISVRIRNVGGIGKRMRKARTVDPNEPTKCPDGKENPTHTRYPATGSFGSDIEEDHSGAVLRLATWPSRVAL